MSDAPDRLLDRVRTRIFDTLCVPPGAPWYLAYSGGLDSTVLLHLLVRLSRDGDIQLIALHADHGLHGRSDEWRRHCEKRCLEWGVDCRATKLALAEDSGLGPEGRAREARYEWFAGIAGRDSWLFTAHHRTDQAETVIERLTRGSGPRGLRGILPVARMHGLAVARPLLDTGRDAIREYARFHKLSWVQDESNEDPYFTRNFIRSRVLPVLKDRWPGIEASLERTARVMTDAQLILDGNAEWDLKGVDDRAIRGDPSLDIAALRELPAERRRNLLRYWIHRELGATAGFRRLNQIVQAVDSYPERSGGLRWPPLDLRLYHGRLYLVRPFERPVEDRAWDLGGDLCLAGRIVRRRRVDGRGLKEDAVKAGVTVGFRRGGEKCRLPRRRHRHSLKKILQDARVPPWQRGRIPLIYRDGEIAAVVGVACCDPYAADPGEPGIEFQVVYDGPGRDKH